MIAAHRTEIQIALLVAGIVAWGLGQRSDSATLEYVGIGFFAAATLLRVVKPRKEESNEG